MHASLQLLSMQGPTFPVKFPDLMSACLACRSLACDNTTCQHRLGFAPSHDLQPLVLLLSFELTIWAKVLCTCVVQC